MTCGIVPSVDLVKFIRTSFVDFALSNVGLVFVAGERLLQVHRRFLESQLLKLARRRYLVGALTVVQAQILVLRIGVPLISLIPSQMTRHLDRVPLVGESGPARSLFGP